MTTKTAVVAQESPTKKQTGRKTAVFLLPIFSILFTILLVEGGLRLAIAADIPYFRNPALYTYPFTDDYWKLLYRWDGRATDGTSENVNPDPFLGWTPRTTSENPLGLMGQEPYVPDLDGDVVLFYGDSFVAGKTENAADNVPNQLAQHITADAVYNFGVSNYGVDQIYLRFRETHT
ncbi:MAG: hypothetical protein KC421_30365, partial [Anaerolineales bacterium]|nr:hypothetical protein [Anaerolineales bacterium]